MCGIAGIIGVDGSKNKLEAMLSAQVHRGPDYTGKYVNESKKLYLGHNRLSIIDISKNSNQPFQSEDGKLTLIFNGEIYNYIELKEKLKNSYKFKTNSDTEVLLAAYIKWGKQCLSKLNGMFSFVIWDDQKNSLFACRDRFGVKPFYYSFQNHTFYFASEIKTLFRTGLAQIPNNRTWANYYKYGQYGSPSETFWNHINQLPPGCVLIYMEGKLDIKRWYNFESEIQLTNERRSIETVKSQYLDLLDNSIQLRFRADVPVGFNISGGVDSSVLLSQVRKTQNGNNVKAYTFYTNSEKYDELPWVKELISITNNPLSTILLESKDVPDLARKVAYYQDEPYGGVPTLAYFKIFEQARRDGVIVLLDGQGMDEQWAGYDYYFNESAETIQGVSNSPFCESVLNKDFLTISESPNYPKPFKERLLNLQYRDLFYTKIPRVLRFNDRISMAASTELREPFLDYRLIEFAFSQPTIFKKRNGTQKYLLREIAKEQLKSSIAYAPKRPLQTPQREWLRVELREWVGDLVLTLGNCEWFDKNRLQEELDNYFYKESHSSFHIWQWVNTSLILKKEKFKS